MLLLISSIQQSSIVDPVHQISLSFMINKVEILVGKEAGGTMTISHLSGLSFSFFFL